MKSLALCLIVFTPTIAFQCFQCDSDSDGTACIDQETECPEGTEGCSMMMYVSVRDDDIHLRKFCTSPSTSVSQYLRMFPGSAMCQSISTDQNQIRFGSVLERRRREALPPAPPQEYTNNLLCVCTTPLCNGGTHKEVINRIVLGSFTMENELGAPLSLQGLDD